MAAGDHVTADTRLARQAVGLPTSIGATFGLIVATTVMVTVPQGFAASWIFAVALAIGLLVMYLQAMSFSELATMIPKAGSMNEYVRVALGPFFATVTVLVGYVAIVFFPGTAEAFLPAVILTEFLGAGLTFQWWVVIIVGVLGVLNLVGVKAFAALEVPLTYLVAGSLTVIGVLGLAGASGDPIGGPFPAVPFSWGLLWTLLGLAVFTFVGVEYTCPLVEELRRPARDIPWGIFIGLGLVGVTMFLYGLAAVRYIPPDQLADPTHITNMDVAAAMFGKVGTWWMGILSVLATMATLNAVAAGVPRILYGMALTGQVPSVFGYLLPRTRTPAVGIVVVTLIPILMNVFGASTAGRFIELILAGVLGWATAYVLIHISLIVLRVRAPHVRRPYRSPWFPVPQVVGIAFLVLAALKIAPPGVSAAAIYRNYGIFLAVAVVYAFVWNAVTQRGLAAQFRAAPLDSGSGPDAGAAQTSAPNDRRTVG